MLAHIRLSTFVLLFVVITSPERRTTDSEELALRNIFILYSLDFVLSLLLSRSSISEAWSVLGRFFPTDRRKLSTAENTRTSNPQFSYQFQDVCHESAYHTPEDDFALRIFERFYLAEVMPLIVDRLKLIGGDKQDSLTRITFTEFVSILKPINYV